MISLPYFEWSYNEYWRLVSGMGLPAKQSPLSVIRDRFGDILLNRAIFPVNRGRGALTLALRIFRQARPEADEVIAPAYVCPSVVDAVVETGLRVVPVDIDSNLNLSAGAVEKSISGKTLAVIAVHMYGCPAPIREIDAVCRQHGVFLIDDSAQVVGVAIGGQPLGTFGDIGIVSFSQSKSIVTGDHNAGGLLVVNNRDLEKDVAASYRALPEARRCWLDLTMFIGKYQVNHWAEKPAYHLWRLLEAMRIFPNRFEDTTRMNDLVAALAVEQLNSLQRRIEGRTRVAFLYHRKLSTRPLVGFPQFAPGRYLTRIVVALPGDVSVNAVRDGLRQKGIPTRGAYPVYSSDSGVRPERALALQPRLIELPSHSRMTAGTIEKVWSAFDSTLNARSSTLNSERRESACRI
jgi:dTDP-4-amino-4,6-dideoxygalactose transaminase